MMVVCYSFKPGKRGKKSLYVSKGLKCRKVGTGVYRFKISNGRQIDRRAFVEVEILEPWCDEEAMTLSPNCSAHGRDCARDGKECHVVMEPSMAKKWMPVVTMKEGFFEVGLFRLKASKKKSLDYRPASGAGFAVMVTIPV